MYNERGITLTNYYQDLIRRIQEHIDKAEYKEASVLIVEELALPYVPADTYEKLKAMRDDIKGYLNEEKAARFMSEQEVLDNLLAGGEKAYKAVNYLNRVNMREYLDVIQEYFLSDECERMVSSVIFEVAHRQDINARLQYCNNGSWHTVNPHRLTAVTDAPAFGETLMLMTDKFENINPSFLELCRQVLAQYAYLKYPDPLDENAEILFYQIIRYVYNAYGDKEGWQRFVKENGIDEKAIPEFLL